MAARGLLGKLKSAEDITVIEEAEFYRNIVAYYESVSRYLSTHLPLDDDFLRIVMWIDPRLFPQSNYEAIEGCALRFI